LFQKVLNMNWLGSQGEKQAMEYSEVCAGKFHDYLVKEIADEIRLILKNDTLLESEAKKDGNIILPARKELISSN
jgi:hypothetical protein